jgi:hypothetical protein
MKWSELHNEINESALKIKSLKEKLKAATSQEKPVIIDRGEYTELFWTLLRIEVKKSIQDSG